MLGLYFSGTGNTEYAVKTFIKAFEGTAALSITDAKASESIKQNDFIVFGYPVQFSETPKIVKDFIENNKTLFNNKKVFIIATMGFFSGDGAGTFARQIKKYSAKIVGGLHIKMPDSIADEKLFAKQDCTKIIEQATKKIEKAAKKFKSGKPTKHGLSFLNRISGLFIQRLWFGGKTRKYHKMPKVNLTKCIGCGICTKECLTNNLKMQNGKITNGNNCTLCYRCVNLCPKQALTVMGNRVYKQYILDNIKKR